MIIDSKQKWPLKLRSVASTLNGRAHLCVNAEKKTQDSFCQKKMTLS